MDLIDFLFPPKCVACGEVLDGAPKRVRHKGNDALCPDCRAKWENAKLEKCSSCGRAFIDCRCVPWKLKAKGCKTLLKLCAYNSDPECVENRLLFCLKKFAIRRCEKFLATQLSMQISRFISEYSEYEFCITNVPRLEKNKKEYGYDHAELLARLVSERCNVTYVSMLKRNKDGDEQKTLSEKDRIENIKGAFTLARDSEKARGKVIILIDDVVTTGVSLAEGYSCLRSKGFDHVLCACLMLTLKKPRKKTDEAEKKSSSEAMLKV